MKIILFRFEKTILHYLCCEVIAGNLTLEKIDSINLESFHDEGEKYKAIYDELNILSSKFIGYHFYYLLPRAGTGGTDHIRFANEAILNLFCTQNQILLNKLYRPEVRQKIGISDKDLKEQEKLLPTQLSDQFKINKTSKLMDGFIYLYLIKGLLNG